MFETLRRMIFPIIIIVLLFFVAMIVFEWGLGLSRQRASADASVAAIINGEKIPWETYNRIYSSMYKAESKNYEEDLPEDKVREIHQQAWRQLLHDYLLMQQVRKHNITVTDEEIYAFLRYNPPPEIQQYFQTDGKFDYQKYFNAMADPQASGFWASLEPFARESIMKQKLQEMVIQTAHVTEPEVKEYFLDNNEKVKVGFINVKYERFSRPPPRSTEEELEEFYNQHKEDYPIDERAALNIALLEKKPAPMDWERTFKKASAIYDSIKAGADFAEMAKKYSEDPSSAKNGGDLGWFPKGQMVEAFDRKVFSMKKGEISEPIRTKFGWHIIKVHDFKEEKEVPRGKKEKELVKKVHASHILISTKPSQETLDKAYRRLEEFLTAAKKKGFFKAAQDLKIPIKSTTPFFRGKTIQYIGRDMNAHRFAFEHKEDEISGIMENNSAYFVLQVAKRFPAGMATFEEAKEKVKLDIVKYKVAKICRDTANAIYEEIQNGVDIKKAAKNHGEKYQVSEPFTRTAYVKGIGRYPTAIGAAFSLKEPGQISKPIDYEQGTIIYKLLERITPDLTEYNNQRDSLYAVILNYKRQELYSKWFEHLVETSDIVNNTEQLLEEQKQM